MVTNRAHILFLIILLLLSCQATDSNEGVATSIEEKQSTKTLVEEASIPIDSIKFDPREPVHYILDTIIGRHRIEIVVADSKNDFVVYDYKQDSVKVFFRTKEVSIELFDKSKKVFEDKVNRNSFSSILNEDFLKNAIVINVDFEKLNQRIIEFYLTIPETDSGYMVEYKINVDYTVDLKKNDYD